MNCKATILIVDDELLNLEILSEHLHDANYQTIRAEDGQQAINLLFEDKQRFQAVLLDRMMPDIDGIEILLKIRQDPQLAMLPVILQSAKAVKQDISDGLEAGASYYLTKPFDGSLLLSIVDIAINDYEKYREMKANSMNIPIWQDHETFNFRTPAEAQNLARIVTTQCENGEIIAIRLLKFMTEAIEHGNLEIDFDQKSKLMAEGRLFKEVQSRLEDPVLGSRNANLIFDRNSTEYRFQIISKGQLLSPGQRFDKINARDAQTQSIAFDRTKHS